MPPRKPISCYIVFDTDIASYHLDYIREGIVRHFASGTHQASFFPLGISELDAFTKGRKTTVGVIGNFDSERALDFFRKSGIHWLNLAERQEPPEIGFSVTFRGEGQRAAEFLIEDLGLTHIGFYGWIQSPSNHRRLREFTEAAERWQITPHIMTYERVPIAQFYGIGREDIDAHIAELSEFLRTLPKPAGVFCGDDRLALRICTLARHIGIAVPRELSVIGVGSLHRASGGWQESVSVVQLNHRLMGTVAARLMEEFLTTGTPPRSVSLPPDNVIHRYTTLRRSVNDALVREAMERIQADPSASIQKLCVEMGVTRRMLERHFQSALGNSIGNTLDLERFSRAKDLLKSFRYNLESVAALAGYTNSKNMRRSFLRHMEISPTEYRHATRAGKKSR